MKTEGSRCGSHSNLKVNEKKTKVMMKKNCKTKLTVNNTER